MNVNHQGLVLLLRSAITGESLPLPEGFCLENIDELVRSQSLSMMVYQGAFNCGISRDSELMKQYHAIYYSKMLKSEQQLRAIRRLFQAFEQNGIDYLPLKGCNLKGMYPQPELRPMGDADVLIRVEQYDKIRPIMEGLSYTEKKESHYDFCWNSPALYVELHKRLFGDDEVDLYRFFGDGWSLATKGDGYRYHMSPEDEFVYVFCHMMKHFRFCGIGARQIVDLYVYRQAHPQMDEAKVEQRMHALQLTEFYHNMQQLLRVWFEGQACDPVTDYITAYVFSNGNWGSGENKMYSEEIIRAKKGVKNARSKSFLKALFPPMAYMQLSYNVMYRHPWLYPVFWVVRAFRILIYRRKRIKMRMGFIKNMSDEKVEAHRDALAYMGLNYDAWNE